VHRISAGASLGCQYLAYKGAMATEDAGRAGEPPDLPREPLAVAQDLDVGPGRAALAAAQ
jgi:hypothetical protein